MTRLVPKLLVATLVVSAAVAVGAALWVEARMAEELALPEQGLVVEIPPGGSLRALLSSLEEAGQLHDAELVRLVARYRGDDQRIQAGEFLLPQGSSADDLLRLLTEGRPIQYSFTVIEGLTFRQMLADLQQHEAIVVQLGEASDAEVMRAIGAEREHPEGMFLPDTYHFPRGQTDTAFLRRAHRALLALLEQEWPQRDPEVAVTTPYEAVILASIVEKETGLAEERPTIAGVFDRRLKRRMRLETDPTVIYGMGAAFDGNIRRRDLERDTPYNTYTRRGLTPTPIALASAEAIRAALHPEPGDVLYFVARGDGSHQFSATYEEHLAAVRRYQLRRGG